KPLTHVPNVRLFLRQVRTFRMLLWNQSRGKAKKRNAAVDNPQMSMALGQCMATIAYAQLIAENAQRHAVDARMIAAIFHLLVNDLNGAAQMLGSLGGLDKISRM